MKTLIEKDSPVPALLLLGGILIFFIGCGLGLAYLGGVFTGKNEVIENDKRITDLALHKPSGTSAPGSGQH